MLTLLQMAGTDTLLHQTSALQRYTCTQWRPTRCTQHRRAFCSIHQPRRRPGYGSDGQNGGGGAGSGGRGGNGRGSNGERGANYDDPTIDHLVGGSGGGAGDASGGAASGAIEILSGADLSIGGNTSQRR